LKGFPNLKSLNCQEQFLILVSFLFYRTIDTPHVVQLLGVVTEGFPQFVVLELMENGDLKKHLRTLRRSPPNQSVSVRKCQKVAKKAKKKSPRLKPNFQKKQARKGFRPISASLIFLGSLKEFSGNFRGIVREFLEFFLESFGISVEIL
jgi:hypothetical protein